MKKPFYFYCEEYQHCADIRCEFLGNDLDSARSYAQRLFHSLFRGDLSRLKDVYFLHCSMTDSDYASILSGDSDKSPWDYSVRVDSLR